MPRRTQGLNDNDTTQPTVSAPPAPTSPSPSPSPTSRRTSGMENENTAPARPREKPTTPDVTGGAYTYDTSGGWLAALHNLAVKTNNITRLAQDAYTYHALDALQGLFPGSPSAAELRAQTDASKKDVGPYAAAAIDAAARMANPVSRVGGENIGTMAAANALREGTAALLHGDDPTVPAVVGGLTGAAPVGLNLLQRVKEPALTTLGATYFGTPGALVGQAISHAVPPPGPLSWSTSKLSQILNPAVQGIISGQTLPDSQSVLRRVSPVP